MCCILFNVFSKPGFTNQSSGRSHKLVVEKCIRILFLITKKKECKINSICIQGNISPSLLHTLNHNPPALIIDSQGWLLTTFICRAPSYFLLPSLHRCPATVTLIKRKYLSRITSFTKYLTILNIKVLF